jgi:exodeoxyribonuclease VII small subunit
MEVVSDEMSFEAARDALAEVVSRLEQGGLTLEQSLALWERGELLAAECQRWLDNARARLAEVAIDDGIEVPTSVTD